MPATHEPPVAADRVRDEVRRFGPVEQLVGILSQPVDAAATSVVILNAGVLHRVGPHRLHVVLARRLAALGFPTLRLDLGGIGDSVASSDAPTFRESAVADTRLAMSGLATPQHVIVGICAGADNALATALVDDRVAGIVLVDPYVYASRQAKWRHVRVKLSTMTAGERLRWAVGAVALRLGLVAAPARVQSGGREYPPIADYRRQLGALVDKGVRILAVHSGTHGVRYNHAEQLFELFPELRGRLDCVYCPDANHTFTELGAQAELIAIVADWISARFR
jgi:hypothetical protein